MHLSNALLPLLGLLGLASCGRTTTAQAQFPAANANRRRTPTPSDAASRAKKAADDAAARAAVDAAVSRAIREDVSAPATPATATGPVAPEVAALINRVKKPKPVAKAVVDALKPVRAKAKAKAAKAAPSSSSVRSSSSSTPDARRAAEQLAAFLKRTKRFGTKNDRPVEVQNAQQAMGLKPDGIVGPDTRKRAAALGVKLPAR